MAKKKAITEEQLRAANKAGYSTQQIAQEINKYEKRTWNDAVFAPTYKWPAEWTAENNAIAQGIKPPVAQDQTVQPITQAVNPNTIDTSTGKPVSESPENVQYSILPENVTGVKPNVVKTPYMENRKKTVETAVPTATDAAKADLDNAMGEKKVLSDRKENAFNFYLKNSGQSEEQLKETLKSAGYTDDEITEKLKGIANSTKPEYNAVWPNGEIRGAIDPATGKPAETSDIEKQAQATGVQYTMKDGIATYNPTTPEEAKKILAMGGKIQQESAMTAVAQANLD